MARIHIRYNLYMLHASRVGFPPALAELFALQALELDGYDISDVAQVIWLPATTDNVERLTG